jgi:hypothetical protein
MVQPWRVSLALCSHPHFGRTKFNERDSFMRISVIFMVLLARYEVLSRVRSDLIFI